MMKKTKEERRKLFKQKLRGKIKTNLKTILGREPQEHEEINAQNDPALTAKAALELAEEIEDRVEDLEETVALIQKTLKL